METESAPKEGSAPRVATFIVEVSIYSNAPVEEQHLTNEDVERWVEEAASRGGLTARARSRRTDR